MKTIRRSRALEWASVSFEVETGPDGALYVLEDMNVAAQS